ncbi:exosome nuclease subunit [Rhodotorula kratochvilovae]
MADLAALLDQLQAAIVPSTSAAAALPDAADLAFERTLSRRLAKGLDQEADRILALASSVLSWASPPAGAAPRTELDPDLIREGVYGNVIERVESLLEQADDGIEKHLGIGKNRAGGVGAVGAKSAAEMDERTKSRAKQDRLPARLLHDASLEKPQKRFSQRTRVPIPDIDDDGAAVPLWKPVLRRKVHALAGADGEDGWLQTELHEPSSSYTVTTATVPPPYTRYTHPYAPEIAALSPPAHSLAAPAKPAPHPANSFDKVPFEWVGDAHALERMVQDIRKAGEDGHKDLAIDLEHHDMRAWAGTTCLIQLSTRSKDYVIDALEPAVRDGLDSLNEFFTNPEWVKVLHGASSDIVWLQRDFGLYVVGLFDTYHATKVLGYSQHSLASLLAMYTDFEPDKRYQLADWRIRPLPKEMLHYARSDTHFLLSIYDHLRLALHAKGASSSETPTPLEDVFDRSRSVSSIVFSLPPFDAATGHYDSGFLVPLAKHGVLKAYATARAVPTLPIKTGWGPGEAKLEVLRSVMRWRERTAREEDESARYVLSLQGALQLAELGAAGRVRESRDVMQVLGAARGGVSDVVRRRKDELALVVRETVDRVAPAANAGDDAEMLLPAAAAAAAAASVQLGLPAEEPAVRPAEGIWAREDAPVASTSAAVSVSVPLAAGSAFFGGAAAAAAPARTEGGITATASTFFGGANAAAAKKEKGKGKGKARSGDEAAAAVQRVHEALTLGGGLGQTLQPKLPPAAAIDTSAALASNEVPLHSTVLPTAAPLADEAPTALSADHAYVPLPGRLPKPASASALAEAAPPAYTAPKKKDSDVIVVSALADKPKKRRARPAEGGAADAGGEPRSPPAVQPPAAKKAKKALRPEAGSVAPHDYAGEASILDAEPVGKTGAARRAQDKAARKKEARAERLAQPKKDKGIDTSEFGRAPRVNNAPKKGNANRTFAS